MLPTFKQIHPPKSRPVTAAIEKWKETTFPLSNSPCCWKTFILKKERKEILLHLESESAHPLNEELRAHRPDPNTLLPGDKIQVPDKEIKTVDASTGKR